MRLPDAADTSEARGDVRRGVRGAVVDHDDFGIRKRLPPNALDRRAKEAAVVVTGDHNGDEI
jgi:hypothetical protein